MRVKAVPFDAEAFAPFGECFALRDPGGERHDFAAMVSNGRSHANLNVSVGRSKPTPGPIRVEALERHDFSAQVFAPIIVSRWMAAVAPNRPDGGPDFEKLKAFILDETVGICYRANVWHHPYACFDAPAEMLMLRWDDRTEADTTWAKVPEGFTLEIEV